MLTPTSLAREDNDCQCCRPCTIWDNACCVFRCFFACRKSKSHKRGTTLQMKTYKVGNIILVEKKQNGSMFPFEERR